MQNTTVFIQSIDGWMSRYAVSTTGQVYSFHRSARGRLMKLSTTEKGYQVVYLRLNGRRVRAKVHRLVAATFLGMTDNQEVDHIDRNRKNNRVDNLRIVSRQENLERRVFKNEHIYDAECYAFCSLN